MTREQDVAEIHEWYDARSRTTRGDAMTPEQQRKLAVEIAIDVADGINAHYDSLFYGNCDDMRDLREDIAICDAATSGPWSAEITLRDTQVYDSTDTYPIAEFNFANGDNDARFTAAARTGWPHAIERAIRAEAEVRRLRNDDACR